jgi:hypothetical protein
LEGTLGPGRAAEAAEAAASLRDGAAWAAAAGLRDGGGRAVSVKTWEGRRWLLGEGGWG